MTTPNGRFVISLDFELHWGVRDLRDLAYWKPRLDGARRAVPAILELFEQHGIHATWATVGFLFFSSREELIAALPGARPAYARGIYSPYPDLSHIGLDEKEDPYHFAPSLIRLISSTPHQEVGCHTMSHYYCLEEGQTVESFRADLEAAIAAARGFGARFFSLVFPRNQVSEGYLRVCADLGIRAYRGTASHWIYRPRAFERESQFRRALRFADAYFNISGHNTWDTSELSSELPVDVRASRYLRPYCGPLWFLEPLRLRRVCSELEFAARYGKVYHLWFHPEDFGLNLEQNLRCLRRVLEHFSRLRDRFGMESANMAELSDVAVRAAPGRVVREAANLTQI
jgi:peptidoglycan/xylan/chitin deacetylase (PgdA/CDA1 family)